MVLFRPKNYHLVSDVTSRLSNLSEEDFILLNGDLSFADTSRDEVLKQLGQQCLTSTTSEGEREDREALCARIRQQSETDKIRLVEIDETLCSMMDVSREYLAGIKKDTAVSSATVCDVTTNLHKRPKKTTSAAPACGVTSLPGTTSGAGNSSSDTHAGNELSAPEPIPSGNDPEGSASIHSVAKPGTSGCRESAICGKDGKTNIATQVDKTAEGRENSRRADDNQKRREDVRKSKSAVCAKKNWSRAADGKQKGRVSCPKKTSDTAANIGCAKKADSKRLEVYRIWKTKDCHGGAMTKPTKPGEASQGTSNSCHATPSVKPKAESNEYEDILDRVREEREKEKLRKWTAWKSVGSQNGAEGIAKPKASGALASPQKNLNIFERSAKSQKHCSAGVALSPRKPASHATIDKRKTAILNHSSLTCSGQTRSSTSTSPKERRSSQASSNTTTTGSESAHPENTTTDNKNNGRQRAENDVQTPEQNSGEISHVHSGEDTACKTPDIGSSSVTDGTSGLAVRAPSVEVSGGDNCLEKPSRRPSTAAASSTSATSSAVAERRKSSSVLETVPRTSTSSCADTTGEPSLPILENPFEDIQPSAKSVGDDEGCGDDPEMPELTLCAF